MMYWCSRALQEGTRFVWQRCDKDYGMGREFYDRLEEDLMGLTKDDLAKARDGLTKLKQNLATLAAKAKKTVPDQRKSGPGALTKAGTALRKERERLFKDYAPGAEKFNKAARNYYFLRGKGAARKMVSPQQDFRPLDVISQSTGIPEITGSVPTLAHRFAIQVLGPDAPPLPMAANKTKKRKADDSLSNSISVVPCVSKPTAKKGKVEGGRPRRRPPTRDVVDPATIVDPANSPHSRSLQAALPRRGFPCTRVVCKVRDVVAKSARTRHSRPCRIFRTPQPAPRPRLCG